MIAPVVPGPWAPFIAGLGGLFSLLGFGSGNGRPTDAERISVGQMPDPLTEWLQSLPAPEGTPAEKLATSNSFQLQGAPIWLMERMGELGFVPSAESGRGDPWWMNFIKNPWTILTGANLTQLSRPWGTPTDWQPAQQGTGETPTEGGGTPGGATEGPDVGTGEGPATFSTDVYSQINDIATSNQMSWEEKAAALAGLGVAAAVIPYYIGQQPTVSTTVTAPTPQEQNPTPPAVPPAMPEPTQNWWEGLPTYYGQGTAPYPVTEVPPSTPAAMPVGAGDWWSGLPGFSTTVIGNQWPTGVPMNPTIPTGTSPTPTPSPVGGSPTPAPVPGVNPPATTGASTGTPTKPDVGSILGGLGSMMMGGGGAGPPGMPAPVVGGGQTQSQFAMPFAVAPAPPTLMQFVRALSKGGLF